MEIKKLDDGGFEITRPLKITDNARDDFLKRVTKGVVRGEFGQPRVVNVTEEQAFMRLNEIHENQCALHVRDAWIGNGMIRMTIYPMGPYADFLREAEGFDLSPRGWCDPNTPGLISRLVTFDVVSKPTPRPNHGINLDHGEGTDEQKALHKVITEIYPLLVELEILTTTTISLINGGRWFVSGDLRLLEAITKKGVEKCGLEDPALPQGISIVASFPSGMPVFEILGFPTSTVNEDKTGNNGAAKLATAINLLMTGSAIDFHEDGRITGVGMGKFIARSLNASVPGDGLYDLIHHPDIVRPIRIMPADINWGWLFNIPEDKTRH